MSDAVLRFRLLGFPVHVSWTALFLLGFIGLSMAGDGRSGDLWARAAAAVALVVISILVHELGHAVVGRRLGLEPQRIVLHGFGGQCEYGRTPTPRQSLVSSLAGPGAGLVLGVAALVALLVAGDRLPFGPLWALELLAWINLVWSVFNLLPAWPLDGGHAMAATLQMLTTPQRAWRITRWVSVAVAIPVAIFGYLQGYIFVPLIMLFVVMQNFRR